MYNIARIDNISTMSYNVYYIMLCVYTHTDVYISIHTHTYILSALLVSQSTVTSLFPAGIWASQ